MGRWTAVSVLVTDSRPAAAGSPESTLLADLSLGKAAHRKWSVELSSQARSHTSLAHDVRPGTEV